MTPSGLPEGFEPHFRKSPLTDPWEPLYSKRLPDRVVVGLYVREPHTNSRGMLHGGLIAAQMIFINEKYEGVHVINNADPSNPIKYAFITVPGCIDIAMKGKTLYVDNAIDLVALDVSDPLNVQVTERIPGIFPELRNNEAYWESMNFDRSKFVIVGWKDTTVKGGGYVE